MAQNNTHYCLLVSESQKSGRTLVGFSASRSLTKLQSRSSHWSQLKAQLGKQRSLSKFTPTVVGRIQFLKGFWTETISFLLAVVQRLPSVSCHVGLANVTAYFIKASNREYQQDRSHGFYNLISKVTSLHFHHIVVIRCKSQGPDHTQREGITQGQEYQKAEVTGSCLLYTARA